MANRPELVQLRDVVIRYFHLRASLEEVQELAQDAGRSMQTDGLPMEEILVLLRGAVSLAAEHVNQPSTSERAVWLRSQMTPWLIALYLNEAGGFDQPEED